VTVDAMSSPAETAAPASTAMIYQYKKGSRGLIGLKEGAPEKPALGPGQQRNV
jgi:hypothetical protein